MDVINVYDEYIDKKNRKLEEERYDNYKDWFLQVDLDPVPENIILEM